MTEMPDEVKKVFSKKNLLEKQRAQKEEYDKKIAELRQTMRLLAESESGLRFLRYLFILCGGDSATLRRTSEGVIDKDETLVTLGIKAIWEKIRFDMDSETLKKVERHLWEDNQ
ncbi:MAG: hypothetical protein M0P69_01465 [Bacteroidales bacterium]|nr:hypothetical protein [Bacteroidales bacterium]